MVFITKKNCKLGMKSKDIRPGGQFIHCKNNAFYVILSTTKNVIKGVK